MAYHVCDGIYIMMLLIVVYGRVPSTTSNALSKHARRRPPLSLTRREQDGALIAKPMQQSMDAAAPFIMLWYDTTICC